VTVLEFVTRLMSIKSKFAFSINCYKELVDLISEVLPTGHKMPKDIYQSKKLLEGCDRTSQVIRPTYSCPCPTDLKHPCRCP
jgi:hypothetical protein